MENPGHCSMCETLPGSGTDTKLIVFVPLVFASASCFAFSLASILLLVSSSCLALSSSAFFCSLSFSTFSHSLSSAVRPLQGVEIYHVLFDDSALHHKTYSPLWLGSSPSPVSSASPVLTTPTSIWSSFISASTSAGMISCV